MPKVIISEEMAQEINDSFKTMSVYEKLSHIQNEINVPKNLYNKFGNYYYRNAETIFDTAKPVCMKYRTTLVVSDEVVNVDGRFYIKGIATLCDWDSDKEVTNVAYAREEEAKKGMDASQVTGSCSSYARKYALNGLFNLDDNKDSDSPEQIEEIEARAKANAKNANNKKEKAEVMATESQLKMIHELGSEERIEGLKKHYKVNELSELTIDQASQAIKILKAGGNK